MVPATGARWDQDLEFMSKLLPFGTSFGKRIRPLYTHPIPLVQIVDGTQSVR